MSCERCGYKLLPDEGIPYESNVFGAFVLCEDCAKLQEESK